MTPGVDSMKNKEQEFGLLDIGTYASFQERADAIKHSFLSFLLEQRRVGKKSTAYGAAAKGNTLLNYCGIKGTDLIEFVVDASPHKQGRYLPGSHIPIVHKETLYKEKPDVIIIFPWNISDEIVAELGFTREWGCDLVVAIPELRVL